VFEVNGGSLKEIQSTSTLPADYKGNNSTAEIQIDADGRFLYVTNRGHDSIAVYAIDAKNGTLTPAGCVAKATARHRQTRLPARRGWRALHRRTGRDNDDVVTEV
jgi:6-phosphogluconolactonase